jgi:riboflavin kinase/FMN adenylyltransferase
MIVWNGLESVPAGSGPFVATIGNYDGVHLGHRRILDEVTALAAKTRRTSLVVTFDPHPVAVVAPSRMPKLLATRRQKLDAFASAGVDAVLVVAFDAHTAALDGETFLRDLLLPRVPLAALRVGMGFRFGRGRGGDLALLQRVGRERGFDVAGVAHVEVAGETVSSSSIRAAVEAGEVERAAALLGRAFAVEGVVTRGDGRGRTMSFPTANVAVENELFPRRGVYVTETVALAARHPSVTNVGTRPTFGGESLTVETHLMDFDEDLYGERVEVRFLARLRDEKRFSGMEELADQIARDRAAASAWFSRLPEPAR